MKSRLSSKRWVILPILMTFVAIVLLAFGSNLLITPVSSSFGQLSNGWSIRRGDEVYSNVTLSEFRLENAKKGEVVTIYYTIPPKYIIAPTIMFKSSLSAVEVSIDGEPVYSFGLEYAEKGKFIPKKYNMVTISDETKPHNIEISFTISEDDAFNRFYPVYYGTKRELVKNFFQCHRLPIFVGGFFGIYACLLFSLGIFLTLLDRNEVSIFISSAVSLLLGAYTYAYNDIFCFLSDRNDLFSIIEYVSLFLIPLSISVLLYTTHPNIASLKQRIILGVNVAMPSLFIIIHMSGAIHINRFVSAIQVISIIETLIILPALVAGVKEDQKTKLESDTYTGVDAESYLLLGFVIIIVFAVLEITKYNYIKYTEITENTTTFTSINFLTLGMLFFIMCLFIYYFLHGIEHLNDSRVKEQLEGLAYTDALTGLMNRAKCMQYLAHLKGLYAVISFDLDNLKKVNDAYGHGEGDRMLRSFAELLKKAFNDANLIGRTGGDEFLVVYESADHDHCEKGLQALYQYMEDFNQTSKHFTLSASSGCAYSTEVSNANIDDVFYLADSRMYKMKETHHDS